MSSVGKQDRCPQRHQLDEDGGVTLGEGLHQAEEMQVDHFRQNLGVRDELKNAWSYFAPEIEENAAGQKLTIVFGCGRCHSLKNVAFFVVEICFRRTRIEVQVQVIGDALNKNLSRIFSH